MIPSTPTTRSRANANARGPTSSSRSQRKSLSIETCASCWATHSGSSPGGSSRGGSSRGRERIPVAKIVAADTKVTALATVLEEESNKNNGGKVGSRAKKTTNSDGGDEGCRAKTINNAEGVEVDSGENITRGSGPKNVIFSNGPKIISECSNLLY
jgi:hypothetical protein